VTYKDVYPFYADLFLVQLGKGYEFMGEDVNKFVDNASGLKPDHPNMKGAQFQAWLYPIIKNGSVKEVGYRRSARASNHGRTAKVYKRIR
jgi:hypothetical protein